MRIDTTPIQANKTQMTSDSGLALPCQTFPALPHTPYRPTFRASSPQPDSSCISTSSSSIAFQRVNELDLSNVTTNFDDSDYQPQDETNFSVNLDVQDDQETCPVPPSVDKHKEKKYVITESQLDILLGRVACRVCGTICNKFQKSPIGMSM